MAPASHSGVDRHHAHLPFLPLTGCHGRHLLRSEQDPTGSKAGACAIIQPGPTPRDEETHIHQVVVASQACPPAAASLPNILSGPQTPDTGPVHGHSSAHESSTKTGLALAASVSFAAPQRVLPRTCEPCCAARSPFLPSETK